jgi:hypothetical protein
MTSSTPVGDALAENLLAGLKEYREHQLLITDNLESAQRLCDQAVSAITAHALRQIPLFNDAKLRDAIQAKHTDPIGAMLSNAFYELRLASHELALEIARRRRAKGSIGKEETTWLGLIEWECGPPEWLDEEPAQLTDCRSQLHALPSDWRLVRVGRNKAPIAGKGWFDVDDFSPDDALELKGSTPPAWGLKSGPASGVIVLDLDADGWRESFEQVTGHTITDLPRTIAWSSGRPGRSGHAFAVEDPDWWPWLANRREWQNAAGQTCWELRGDRCQSVIWGHHPETGSYNWLPGHSPQVIPDPAPAPVWLLEALQVQEDPDAEPVESSTADAARAVEALQCIRAADFTSYGQWLRIGMALHNTDPGLLSAWVEWSREMPNFDKEECQAKWKSFDRPYKGRPATIATLVHLAKQYGYKPKPKAAAGSPQHPVGFGNGPQGCERSRSELPGTPEEKLADLRALAAALLERREQFSSRLPIMRARAQELCLHIRDMELQGLLTSARRRRIHGDSEPLLGPGDVLDLTPEPWIWEGLILRACLNLLVALPKQGKTALVLAMVAAWHRNEPALLDRNLLGPCPPVLIVGTDQGQSDWGRMLQSAGLVDAQGRIGGPIVGLAHAGRPLHLDPEGIDRIAEHAQKHPGLLVVIDSLSACIAPLGLKEESPEIAEPVADLMEQLEPHGATVVLIHHSSKGRAGEGATSASRGSTALPAHASQILKLGPASNNPQDYRRMLMTEGRCGLPQALVIERDGAIWRLLGGPEVLEQERDAAEAVAKLTDDQYGALQFVCDRWEDDHERSTAADLVAGRRASGRDPERVARKQLQGLEKKGLLQSIGTPRPGRGGRLYTYWPTDQGLITARARTPEMRSDGSDGSDRLLACEDPELDQPL